MIDMSTNAILIIVITVMVVIAMAIVLSVMGRNSVRANPDGQEYDEYSAFKSDSDFVGRLNENALINRFGRLTTTESNDALVKIFNASKNPWGITPTIFRGLRLAVVIIGSVISISIYVLFGSVQTTGYAVFLTVLAWWYPMYYYKAIGKEREEEWNKIYEYIWVIKNSSLLYDAKKVCLETRDYIAQHYPHQEEIITGFNDFYEHWSEQEIPEFVLKHYDFYLAKEIYNILYNMAITGTSPDQNLNNLRSFSINKHNGRIQEILSGVPSKATLGTLPFLMLSVVIALLVPMVMSIMKLM